MKKMRPVSYIREDLFIIRVNILISGLKLFLIKGAPCEENETCFLYKGVSYLWVLSELPFLHANSHIFYI